MSDGQLGMLMLAINLSEISFVLIVACRPIGLDADQAFAI